MFSKLNTLVLIICLFGLPSLANADDSCKAVFSDLYSWAAQGNDGFNYWIETKVASIHTPDNNWVSYSTGKLYAIPFNLSGSFESFFSDRLNYLGYPFNPDETDLMELYLYPINWSARMILKSWGNAEVKLNPECANGFMYAFESGNKAMHVFSFKKMKKMQFIPIK